MSDAFTKALVEFDLAAAALDELKDGDVLSPPLASLEHDFPELKILLARLERRADELRKLGPPTNSQTGQLMT